MGVTRVVAALTALEFTQYIDINEIVQIFENNLKVISDQLQFIDENLNADG